MSQSLETSSEVGLDLQLESILNNSGILQTYTGLHAYINLKYIFPNEAQVFL